VAHDTVSLLRSLDFMAAAAQSGVEVPLVELARLGKALKDNAIEASLQKAAGVGYPMQGVPFDSSSVPGGDYAPLVPQSIQSTFDIVTAKEDQLVFQKKITTTDVTQPVFEYTQLRRYGGTAMSPFVTETGVPGLSKSDYGRKTVRMKYMATLRQLTDVAMMTQLLSGVGQARALEASNGSFELALRHEKFLFHADSRINPLEYDGLIASVEAEAPANVIDMEGRTPSGQELQTYLGHLVSPPIYGVPDSVMMTPLHYQWYVNNLVQFKRGDLAVSGPLSLFANQVKIGSYRGEVPFEQIPFLPWDVNPIPRTEGHAPPAPLVPAFAVVADADSRWRGPDVAGRDFYYTFEMVGDNGATRTGVIGPVNLAAGDAVRVDFADGAVAQAEAGSIRSYNAFRASVPAGDPAPTNDRDFKFCGRYARNQANAGATRFFDRNHTRPDTAPIIIGQHTPDVIEWKSFLPVTMRPLQASYSRTEQFLLTMFGALKVGNPNRIIVLKNCGWA